MFGEAIRHNEGIQYVYPAEIFYTHLGSTGGGFSAAFWRPSATAAVCLLPYSLQTFGASTSLLIMAFFPLLGLAMSVL